MANTSILAAFERMWQHVVTALGNKSDISHSHSNATQADAGFLSAEDKIQLDNGGIPIVTASSSDGVAYTATVDGMASLTVGAKITIIPSVNSAATNPTLNVNSLGAKYIRMPITYNTSASSVGAITTWLVKNKPIVVEYDGTYWKTISMPRPSAQYLYGTVPVANGGTGNTSVDTTPTAGSTKMVTSDGIKTALDGKADDSTAIKWAFGTTFLPTMGTIAVFNSDSGYDIYDSYITEEQLGNIITKVDNIEEGANKYTLPVATSSKLGGVKSGGAISVDTSGNVSLNTVMDFEPVVDTNGSNGVLLLGHRVNWSNWDSGIPEGTAEFDLEGNNLIALPIYFANGDSGMESNFAIARGVWEFPDGIIGNVEGNATSATTATSASKATKLETARNIGFTINGTTKSVSFDGTTDVTADFGTVGETKDVLYSSTIGVAQSSIVIDGYNVNNNNAQIFDNYKYIEIYGFYALGSENDVVYVTIHSKANLEWLKDSGSINSIRLYTGDNFTINLDPEYGELYFTGSTSVVITEVIGYPYVD